MGESEKLYVLIVGSLYTLCVITATATGNKVSKHLEAA